MRKKRVIRKILAVGIVLSMTVSLVPTGVNTLLYSTRYPRHKRACKTSRSPLRRRFTCTLLTQISALYSGVFTSVGTGSMQRREQKNSTEQSTTDKADSVSNVSSQNSVTLADYQQDNQSLAFSDTSWNYDAENNVYWQIQVGYCSMPAASEYETMGIYVPGDYMDGKENSDGTYTCTINASKSVNGYTADTAPIVFAINTAGYLAQQAPSSYSYQGLSHYLSAGYIYVYAGMRGRNNGYDDAGNLAYSGGAPWGVTDLKVAIRYYRYNADQLPGDTERIFTFGMSGGGAQSAVAGASGDSELYNPYLMEIGAAMKDNDGNYISDAVCGSMCWCPITSLDYADEAYEWNLGQYASEGTRADGTFTAALSDDMSIKYAEYINQLGLKDKDGNALTLEESETGIYTTGSYYDYLLSVVETSLNYFLSDTTFPYTATAGFTRPDGGFAGGDGQTPPEGIGQEGGNSSNSTSELSEEVTGKSEVGESSQNEGIQQDGKMPKDGEMAQNGDMPKDGGKPENGSMPEMGAGSSENAGTTYETVQDYIASLNAEEEWITYDQATNTASITSMEAFVKQCESASKDVGAFDDLNCSQAENMLFGNNEQDAMHFDSIMASLLKDNQEKYSELSNWDASYVESYSNGISTTDSLGNSSSYRQNMYNPMYYLSEYYEGYGTSKLAQNWRIHTGIEQGDTALTVETNLALALEQCDDVKSVEFETVWNQGHTTAERTGDSTTNFIAWVNECVR